MSGKTNPSPDALAGGLYIVATPLGHARDITLRALDVLGGAEVIYCEDTRHTGKLAALYGIKTRRLAYHEHNAAKIRPQILERLADGEAVALVSDAGTPLISDPGLPLVRAARAAGYAVIPIPGASAPIAALSIAGLATDRFAFIGFLPVKKKPRQAALTELSRLQMTLVLFESPKRLTALLADLAALANNREIIVARELTKTFEEIVGGTAEKVLAYFETTAPRGEMIVLLGPPATATALDDARLNAHLHTALASMSLRDGVQHVVATTGEKRKRVYAAALALNKRRKSDDNR